MLVFLARSSVQLVSYIRECFCFPVEHLLWLPNGFSTYRRGAAVSGFAYVLFRDCFLGGVLPGIPFPSSSWSARLWATSFILQFMVAADAIRLVAPSNGECHS